MFFLTCPARNKLILTIFEFQSTLAIQHWQIVFPSSKRLQFLFYLCFTVAIKKPFICYQVRLAKLIKGTM